MLIGIQLTGCRTIGGVSAVPGTGRASRLPGGVPTIGVWPTARQIREFLTPAAPALPPSRPGCPSTAAAGGSTGLRREEVALLAGVSVDYYNRLERGNLAGVSESVLDALARALQLTDAERGHLYDLARSANTRGGPAQSPAPAISPAGPAWPAAGPRLDHRSPSRPAQWPP